MGLEVSGPGVFRIDSKDIPWFFTGSKTLLNRDHWGISMHIHAEGIKNSVFGVSKDLPIAVLFIEDEQLYAELIAMRMSNVLLASFHVRCAKTLTAGLIALEEGDFDLVLLDLNLPDSSGLKTLKMLRKEFPAVPVVVLTGHDSEEQALLALEYGAQDFLVKGRDEGLIPRAMVYAVERERSRRALVESQQSLRETQMRLVQADKMDTLGRMAAGVAHEVKNPLAILRMGLDYMHASESLNADENLKDICGDMDDAVKRAQTIINEMLDFSVPAQMELKEEDLREVVDQAIRMVRHELDQRRIQWSFDAPKEIPPMFLDRQKIQQVIVNLLMNAAQAIGQDGRISVSTNVDVLSLPGDPVEKPASNPQGSSERRVMLRIRDTGPGIPEKNVRRLFDPFFTSKPVGQGTGLGLSICKNILLEHGAQIDLQNHPEGGVEVKIQFVT